MNISLAAIKMLGDLLTEQDERSNNEQDLEALKELWELYQSLM